MNRAYKAFISYSWSDKAWGGWLHRALETYRTPRQIVGKTTPLGPAPATLHPIFKDREEEAAGHGIGAAIEAAMAASAFLIVICSPRSAKSEWVNREVAWFKRHKDKRRILALVVEGEPGASFIPGREAEECFPATLLYAVDENLQLTDEREDVPLAADARKNSDGKRGAKLKLAAAMLGVGLDDLVRRDERRRTIRRRVVTTGAIALSAAMTGLAFVALTQRDAARRAEQIAEAAQADAEFQRDEAQDLVEFMLTDLRKRLDAVGRLDVLDAVGERLLQSYDKQDLATLDANALGRRARVQLLLGEVDNTRGDLDAALAQYTEAAATTEELLRRAPDDPQRIFNHSQSVFWVGYIAWQRGDRPTALRHLEQYHALATHLVSLDPANDDWKAELMYAHSNLGTLAMDIGDWAEAETRFVKTVDIGRALLDAAPDDGTRVLDLGQSYSWLAEARYHQIRLTDARDARCAEIALYESRGVADDAQLALAAAVARYAMADVDLALGRIDEAVTNASLAVEGLDRLRAAEPESTQLIDRSALARAVLAEALIAADQPDAALGHLDLALLSAETVMAADDTVLLWKAKVRALPRVLQAEVALKRGDDRAALRFFGDVVADLGEVPEVNRQELVWRHYFYRASVGQARLQRASPDQWRKIAHALGDDATLHGPKVRTLHAEALFSAGDPLAAHAIAAPLFDAGYRHPTFVALLQRMGPAPPPSEGIPPEGPADPSNHH